jgi:SPP1 family predicted phage head-tail adaptor
VLSRRGASEAGRLRLRIAFEKPLLDPDGMGGAALIWDPVATIAADVTPMRTDERTIGEGVEQVTRHRITIRSRDDVSAGDRFRLGVRIFAIRSVTDPAEDGRWLVCLCEEEGSP